VHFSYCLLKSSSSYATPENCHVLEKFVPLEHKAQVGRNSLSGKKWPMQAWASSSYQWLARAVASAVGPLQQSAAGVHADYDAVKAGIMLPWSNGPVEGHINRLKMLKRSMFGRATLDLLSRRFLLAA
jgi:transposase